MKKNKDGVPEKQLRIISRLDSIGTMLFICLAIFPWIITMGDNFYVGYSLFFRVFATIVFAFMFYVNQFLNINLSFKPKFHTNNNLRIVLSIFAIIGFILFLVLSIFSIWLIFF